MQESSLRAGRNVFAVLDLGVVDGNYRKPQKDYQSAHFYFCITEEPFLTFSTLLQPFPTGL